MGLIIPIFEGVHLFCKNKSHSLFRLSFCVEALYSLKSVKIEIEGVHRGIA